MAHSHVSALFHCVWAAKERSPNIDAQIREPLYACIGGIARKHGLVARAIGGPTDHVHILLSLPATMSIAQAVKLIKGASSHWVHDTYPDRCEFAWQDGYGAFSISVAGITRTVAYIHNQEAHHRTTTYDDEVAGFLRRHGMPVDGM